MKRLMLCAALFVTLGSSFAPSALASRGSQRTHQTRWTQHDVAVYVVSTLNLLHRSDGQSVPSALHAMDAARYDVFADLDAANLYFISVRNHKGIIIGTFAYRMGASKPECISPLAGKLGMTRAGGDLLHAYRQDRMQLIGSFRSTLPQ